MWESSRLSKRLTFSESTLQEIYDYLMVIDTTKNSWKHISTKHPNTIKKLSHSVIITSTGSSNRIEGNVLTDTEVEDLYQNIGNKPLKTRDEQEVAGYIYCLETIFANYEEMPLTESLILQLHSELLKESTYDQSHRGTYKNTPNRVEAMDPKGMVVGVIFDPTPPYLVRKEIQELVDWFNWALEVKLKHPLVLIANFIFEYLAIHPFQDGNGRTSRLLTNLLLLQSGYEFSKFVSHEQMIEHSKKSYYLALNKTQKSWKSDEEDLTPWLLYFLKIVNAQSEKAEHKLSQDDFENYLTDKQLKVWELIQETETFTKKEVINHTQLPQRTVESILNKFLKHEKIIRYGEGRGVYYKLT